MLSENKQKRYGVRSIFFGDQVVSFVAGRGEGVKAGVSTTAAVPTTAIFPPIKLFFGHDGWDVDWGLLWMCVFHVNTVCCASEAQKIQKYVKPEEETFVHLSFHVG